MRASDLMSEAVICVTSETKLQDAASLMRNHDVGLLPVIDDGEKLVGVITDRDIVCRAVAQGRNPLDLTVGEAMSGGEICSVSPETEEETLCAVMEEHQIRRVPVVDSDGRCCGIVALADLARRGPEHEIAEVMQAVSRPS